MENIRNQNGIKETELLVVSFGTSFNESREKTIGAMEDAMERAFPDISVRRAFTSKMILRAVKKRDGIEMDDVKSALQRAKDNGVKNLVIQPTHLMDGIEYNELMNDLKEYRAFFQKVSVGDPLLKSEDDFLDMMNAVVKDTASFCDGKTAICFMGHGSEAAANGVYDKMQSYFNAHGYHDYYIGTVEAKPDLDDLVNAVGKGNYTRVIMQPLMIVAGDHANNDMAGDGEDSWKSVFVKNGYDVVCILKGLGEIGEIQSLAVAHAQKAMRELKEG